MVTRPKSYKYALFHWKCTVRHTVVDVVMT